jgi:hypothetical protein
LAHIAADLVDRMAILVAVRRFPGMGVGDSRSLRSDSYVRMQHVVRRSTSVPFRPFMGGVCAARTHATFFCCYSWYLGSYMYLRVALQEGSASAVACFPVPLKVFSSIHLLFDCWYPLPFLVRIF